MPKINVYLPDALADAVRDAQLPVSSICQSALERAVRDVTSLRATDHPPTAGAELGLFNRFTPRAREALLTHAQNAARAVPRDYIGPEHVLIGILDEGQNLAIRVLESLDVAPAVLRSEVVGSLHEPIQGVPSQMPFTPGQAGRSSSPGKRRSAWATTTSAVSICCSECWPSTRTSPARSCSGWVSSYA